MRLSRDLTTKIHFVFDQLVPPVLRDSKVFMYVPFKILFGKKAGVFFELKSKAPGMTEQEFRDTYSSVQDVLVQRKTDLNNLCIREIMQNIVGKTVLDAGCGRGYLCGLLAEAGCKVTGCDQYIDRKLQQGYLGHPAHPGIKFVEASLDKLPFSDKSFDTVICTHTLEHVLNFEQSLAELRRVCKQRLIIVIPKQKPYKYTFDLHLRFFPFPESWLLAVVPKGKYTCKTADGDILYVEERVMTR